MEISGERIIKEVIKQDFAAFDEYALEIFRYQYRNNPVYRRFCEILGRLPGSISQLNDIPFLPIRFFKSHTIASKEFIPELVFESSGTTGSVNSRHFVKDAAVYRQSFMEAFKLFFGHPQQYCIIGLLPSYIEKGNSSLVYMVDELVKVSGHSRSGFYLYEHEELAHVLNENETNHVPTILFGVTYALLDFAEAYPLRLSKTIVIETGGMKGRKKELTRDEVHRELSAKLDLNKIHSEYGMTELLSQAYSSGNGIFNSPPWMKILLRSEDDPFEIYSKEYVESKPLSGAVNIIDLANFDSCSFIATDDFGKIYRDGSFEILGRLDNSDTRGCGLMIM